jgi:hypothetical protein
MKKKNLLMTAIAIFGLATITNAQVPSYVPTNGLVGWWPFNGNANDESANGNNGTNNGATLTSDRFGNVNSAYSFDGTNDFINVPEDSTMELNQHTISFWFNSSILPNSRFDLIGKDNTTGNRQYVIQLESSGVIRNAVFTDIQPYIIDGNTIITTNNWINVVVTWDGIINRTYINSNLDTSISTLGNLLQDNWDLFFGGIPSFNQYYFGKLDDIGFWSRALTQQEISDLFTSSTVGISEVSQSNLFSVYPNPANSHINVKADAKLLGSVYTVYDNSGKVVLSGKIIAENTVIELGNLSGGIYLFSVGENLQQTFKVIKE